MPSYLTITSNGLFLFKLIKDSGVQKTFFQDYFKTNQIAGSGDFAKLLFVNV